MGRSPTLIPPKAAFFPARENGVDATAVPNTLADFGAPKAAKSVTTLRGGELGLNDDGVGDVGNFASYERMWGLGKYGCELRA